MTVGIVKTYYHKFSEGLKLESGKTLAPVTVAYETYGKLNRERDNVILIHHALTGSAHAAGKHSPDDKIPGWWDFLIGPGRVFDTSKYFVVCVNVPGSCYGTTGPASINPNTGKPYGLDFPVVTIRDMVNLQKKLLDYLNIKKVFACAGGSMGGMQALELAIMYPDFVEKVIAIATNTKLTAMQIGYNRTQRQAIKFDPNWNNGDYYNKTQPVRGLSLAREIATITYKSDISFTRRFGRKFHEESGSIYDLNSYYEVESYLDYIGNKLPKRFDANCYIYLTKAMDLHDIGRGRGSFEKAVSRIKAQVLSIGITTDILFPTYQQKEITDLINKTGGRSIYREINSPWGHDSFLIDFDKIDPVIREFLQQKDLGRTEKVAL